MPEDYVPVFLQVLAGILFAASTLALSVLIGKRGRRTHAKDQPYECGKDPIGPTHSRFSVKFYLVAMPLHPFRYRGRVHVHVGRRLSRATAPRHGIFYSMFSFIGILFVGYLYALKKKAFDWTHNPTAADRADEK